jgi:NADH dehydrogenase/NADH:ubiquinone oxidoreductase subunit G
MSDLINLLIDGEQVAVEPGSTIQQAAAALGKSIPTICYHEATTSNGLCRLCVVEVEGSRVLVPACVGQVSQGMQVHTHSERALRSRRTILEMLASAVDLSEAPEIQAFLNEYDADERRFPAAERRSVPVRDDNPMYVRDYSKCVLCWRCVQVCAEDAQYTFALNITGRGFETQISTFFDKPLPETTCVFCGQCVGVCPTNALQPKREWLLEQNLPLAEVLQATQTEKKRKRRDS